VTTRAPHSAVVGTIVFTICVPGTVVVLVPFLLSRWVLQPPLLGWAATRWAGVVLLVVAAPLFFDFVIRFVREGHGTPAPIAPTEHLVVGGPFQRVRNPGYVAVVAMIVGQGLLFASRAVLAYAAAIAVVFHVFVLLYEEPTLRRQFGAEYDDYCRRVPRWMPRLRK
jgi:protein-S-isoprenylcysteine O-methyltransferase Ste14